MRRLFRQFSTPGGVPSHVSVPTPGSIHEGGELGYVLMHAFGAAFDNPDLIVAAVVGDGEAETGPLMGSWQGINFLNPARDGAVLPILHLNGYKIASPTVLGRTSDADLRALFEGFGYDRALRRRATTRERAPGFRRHPRHLLRGNPRYPERAHALMAFRAARAGPLIVLRTPKGWTGPEVVHDLPIEGTFRAHQVPLDNVKKDPEQLAALKPGCAATSPTSYSMPTVS